MCDDQTNSIILYGVTLSAVYIEESTEPRHDKTWRRLFPTNFYKNWAVQSKKMAKCMEFR